MTVGAHMPGSSRRWTGIACEPPLRDAIHGPAQQKIRNERKKDGNEQGFNGEEAPGRQVLIDGVKPDRDQDNLARGVQSLAKPVASLLRVGKNRPEVWRSS